MIEHGTPSDQHLLKNGDMDDSMKPFLQNRNGTGPKNPYAGLDIKPANEDMINPESGSGFFSRFAVL